MPTHTPTILLLTANSNADYLENITAEVKEIQRTLNSANLKKEFETILVPEARIQDIIDEFNVPGRAIEVLHFAGHANDNAIALADSPALASALAAKIKALNTVKFVFLNGCATLGQVKYFHEAGVPFVMATRCPVGDDRARWLATHFYLYLTLKRTLLAAMEAVVVDAALTRRITFDNNRGICSLDNDDDDATDDGLEWGLYPAAEGDDYSLPFSSWKEPYTEQSHAIFLDRLVYAISDLNIPRNKDIHALKANMADGYHVPEITKIRELLGALPYTLGVRLRQIVAKPNERTADYFRGLLFDHAIFFETLMHHTVSLQSAKIWQDKDISFQSVPENIAEVRSFLRADRLRASPETYAPVISLLDHWLRAIDPDCILLLEPKTGEYLRSARFKAACGFFFLVKEYYRQRLRLDVEEAQRQCFEAQEYLSEAFHHFRFLVRHTLVSVRGINVMNFRHMPTKYDNTVARLSVNEPEPTPFPGDGMMENKSVLSFFEVEPGIGEASINLFPFIIDRNVFTGKPNNEVDLYLFTGYFSDPEGEPESYHFISANNPSKVWRLKASDHYVSLLHVGEDSSPIHQQNHLMANGGEFIKYIKGYHDQFLQLLQTD